MGHELRDVLMPIAILGSMGTAVYFFAKVMTDYILKKKIEIADLPEDEKFAERFIADENPMETVEESEMEALVMKMIEKLPPQYKVVLTLYHLEDMNYAEIGEATGMPEGTVKNYLFRGRQLLKEKVKTYLGKEV